MSGPRTAPISPTEQVKIDENRGAGLAKVLEPQLRFRNDEEVNRYLAAISKKLASGLPAPAPAPLEVRVVQDRDGLWRSFSLPRAKIYLSAGLLKNLEFENELAAIIALELAHLRRRHLAGRLGDLGANVEFFGSASVFEFNVEERGEAIEDAVKMLYDAGIDPRGLASVWAKHHANPRSTPFKAATLAEMKEKTRKTISEYAPLRNPLVRSAEFAAIRKRIARL